MRQETLNYWKQLTHVLKYFRTEEEPKARLPKSFIQGFLEVRHVCRLTFLLIPILILTCFRPGIEQAYPLISWFGVCLLTRNLFCIYALANRRTQTCPVMNLHLLASRPDSHDRAHLAPL